LGPYGRLPPSGDGAVWLRPRAERPRPRRGICGPDSSLPGARHITIDDPPRGAKSRWTFRPASAILKPRTCRPRQVGLRKKGGTDMSTKVSGLGFCLGVLTGLLTAQAGGPAAKGQPVRAQDITDSVEMIARLPRAIELPIPEGIRELIVWPTRQFLDEHKVVKDRSKDFPSIYPKTSIPDPKPLKPGADTPAEALRIAGWWVRQVLKSEWIPEDLDARLLPIQAAQPSDSRVICRYEAGGNRLQISQSLSAMWVVVQPAKEALKDVAVEGIGPAVFTRFFAMGEQMAAIPGRHLASSGKLEVFLPASTPERPMPRSALGNWWGWQLWYTDGAALAVLLMKRSENRAYRFMPGDPWF
jgi:hypothetical protein